MARITLKIALILGVLAVLIVSVAGCTSNSQNLALAYANALTQPANIGLGPNETLVSSNVVANGSDGARLTETISNTTPQSLWANGTITTLGYNIQYFSSTGEATAFYNNQSFGYTAKPNLPITSGSSPYEQVMGHAPSISDQAYKLLNFNFASAQMNVVVQRGAFVVWGEVTETGISGSSSSLNSSAPTTSGHNAVLENVVSKILGGEANLESHGWKNIDQTVTWHSDNSVTVSYIDIGIANDTANAAPEAVNETLIAFPTTHDATNYVSALNLNNYKLVSTSWSKAKEGGYPVFFDRAPQTYQEWLRMTNSDTIYLIKQYDNFLDIYKSWPPSQTSEPSDPVGM